MKRFVALCAFMLLCVLAIAPATAQATAQAETIHDVVSATWPADLVPVAEQIKYHEGGPYFNDGYCGFGLLPSTQVLLGIDATYMDPYSCSAAAYRLYRWYGWAPWVTYGYYTYGAGYTPVAYY